MFERNWWRNTEIRASSTKTLTLSWTKYAYGLIMIELWPLDGIWPYHPHDLTSSISQRLSVLRLNEIDEEIKKWEQVQQKNEQLW